MSNPFIIYALPRSRTAWLSAFLSYGDYICLHEQAIFTRSIDGIKDLFSRPCVGTVETAAAQAWKIIHHHVPNLKVVVIRRPVDQVINSVLNVDLQGSGRYDEIRLRKVMEYGDRMLRQIAEVPGVLSLNYDDIASEDACAAIFEHCLPYEFDREWWQWMCGRNIQANVPEVVRYYHANRADIEGFKSLCKRELRSLYRAGHINRGANGVSVAHD